MTEDGALILDREQRLAVRDWLIWFLAGAATTLGEAFTDREDGSEAPALMRRLEDGIALLDDLGWSKHDPRKGFELNLDERRLNRVLEDLREEAAITLVGYHKREENEPQDEEDYRRAVNISAAIGRIERHLNSRSLAAEEMEHELADSDDEPDQSSP